MKPKILTVDDSKTIRMIVKQTLADYHCDVIEATDGMEGLAQAIKERPDLILLDIDMPRMNGLDMLKKLRSQDQFKQTPVFMLTSKSKAQNVKIALELGVAAYISKPFKRDDLVDRIDKLLSLSPAKGE